MLTESELADLCRQYKLSDFAIATVNHVRKSPPSRILRSGTHNVVTHYASRKMGCVIKAEARRTELAAIYEWDHDKTTFEFYDQPPQIKKIHDLGGGRTKATLYTPDFFRIADDFVGWVECKPEGWLRGQAEKENPQYILDDQGRWRCPSAEAYAHSVGLKFHVRSSADSDPIVTQNIADLSDYVHADCPPAKPEQLQLAQQFMGHTGWCWLRDLMANDVGLGADAVFKLIADEQLHVDLHAFLLVKEPQRVRVFKTKALLDSSDLWLPPMLVMPPVAIHQIEMVSGTVAAWDGRACEILNVGQVDVFLRMAEGTLQNLPVADFERLVRDGAIVGSCHVVDPRTAWGGELLRKASNEDLRSAMHRFYCIHPELRPRDEVHVASDRAIRKWKAMARRGYAEYGNEFVGLLPTISRRGNRTRRFDARTLEIMQEVIDTEVKSDANPGLFSSWALLKTACEKEGLLRPSKKTFLAEIRRVTTPEELKKAREGEKAGYDLELPFISLERQTPKHGTRPFDIVHIDHTQIDLQFVNESTGAEMGKAWLTVMIDAFSRVILAWVLTFNDPSYRSCMLVIRDCVRRHGRLPRTLVADQGSEFKGTYFEQLLALFGVHKRMRPASHPRFGNIVERFFGLKNTEFTHVLHGNNKALQTPRRMSPTHDPRNLAIWNLRAFREAFEQFLADVYHAVEHVALGVSPAQAFEIGNLQAGTRSHTLITYDRDFVLATLPTTVKGISTIQRDGSFKANRIDYFSETLTAHAGKELEVRYDPFDFSHAYVRGDRGWVEAFSMYAGELAGRTEKEIEAISQEIDQINKRDGIRDEDRAEALGTYLTATRGREVNLAIALQRTRDQELRAANSDVDLLGIPAGDSGDTVAPSVRAPSGKSSGRVVDEIDFDNIPQQDFEDF